LPGAKVTIGRPLPTYRVHLLDAKLLPVPEGTVGELFIGGPGVARGYAGHPELTRERFLPDPFSPAESGERLYRTGDLGRLTISGELEFLGRVDSQVKIRGYRIELSEIESVLLEFPAVQAAVVSTFRPQAEVESQELVAYLVLSAAAELELREVDRVLRERLPPYMIPGYIELVAALPVLPSGKVDRAALPRPSSARRRSDSERISPRGGLEVAIAAVFERFLQVPKLSAGDDFFRELGGHSLLAAQVVSTLRKDARMRHLGLSDLYAHPTVKKLAAHVARLKATLAPRLLPRREAPQPQTVSIAACGLAQAMALGFIFALPGLFALWQRHWLSATSGSLLLGALGCGLITLAYVPLSALLAIAAKWLFIGRFKAGTYPLWGGYYLRWWLVRRLNDRVPLYLFTGSPILNLYFRLMGAKVGRGCYLGSQNAFCFDLLEIGDAAAINSGAYVLGYSVDNGVLIIGGAKIGEQAVVGSHSVIGVGACLGKDAVLLERSLLPPGALLKEGCHASGSPAAAHPASEAEAAHEPCRAAASAGVLFGFSLAAFGLLPAIPLLATASGISLLLFAKERWSGLCAILLSPVGAALEVSVLCTTIIALKALFQRQAPNGRHRLYGGAHLCKWISDKLVETSLHFTQALYATVYLPPFLRALGAKIGRHAEVSTISDITSELLELGDETFIADGASVGPARVERGFVNLAKVSVGCRSFIGNAALVPQGAAIPSGCLIGVQSIPPAGPIDPDTSWVGLPPIFLPRRQLMSGFPDELTFRPSRRLYALRCAYELLRIGLPPMLIMLSFLGLWAGIEQVYARHSLLLTVLALPVLGFGFSGAATLVIALLKWLLIGRYRPRVEPLWSHFVRRTELITGLYENVTVPLLLEPLLGTPFARTVLGLFGAKIGRGVFLETTFLTEFDLVEVADGANVARGVSLQTHLFEDRIMKMAPVRVGARCSAGERSVVLYDSAMEADSSLGPLSLLMKGEVLGAGSKWIGSPARPLALSASQDSEALDSVS
jgi:non-ribosomal peptide synthetase-like protein